MQFLLTFPDGSVWICWTREEAQELLRARPYAGPGRVTVEGAETYVTDLTPAEDTDFPQDWSEMAHSDIHCGKSVLGNTDKFPEVDLMSVEIHVPFRAWPEEE